MFTGETYIVILITNLFSSWKGLKSVTKAGIAYIFMDHLIWNE